MSGRAPAAAKPAKAKAKGARKAKQAAPAKAKADKGEKKKKGPATLNNANYAHSAARAQIAQDILDQNPDDLHANFAHQLIESEISALNELRDKPAGTIRITSVEHASDSIIWPTMMKLLKKYPDINLEIINDYRLIDIVAERYDAGVRLAEHHGKRRHHILGAAIEAGACEFLGVFVVVLADAEDVLRRARDGGEQFRLAHHRGLGGSGGNIRHAVGGDQPQHVARQRRVGGGDVAHGTRGIQRTDARARAIGKGHKPHAILPP